jgi:hypothetical protein
MSPNAPEFVNKIVLYYNITLANKIVLYYNITLAVSNYELWQWVSYSFLFAKSPMELIMMAVVSPRLPTVTHTLFSLVPYF